MTVQNSAELLATVQRLRVIGTALVFGVVVFAAVVWFGMGVRPAPFELAIVSLVAAAFSVIDFVVHLILPGMVAQQAVKQLGPKPSESHLLLVYQTKTIIRLAMLEGAALFCVVAYILDHQIWTLGIAAALVVFMFASIPSKTRIAHWVETQRAVT